MSQTAWTARAAMLAALAGLVVTQAGCIEVALILALSEDDGDEPPEWDEEWDEPPVTEPVAPTVQISIPEWPPLGPSGVMTVAASCPNGIASAFISFRNEVTLQANGQVEALFTPTGTDLGEGLGSLAVTVTASDGAWTTSYVDDLLVDLSPPVSVLGPTTLPASGATFDFWMGDAWIVSRATLEFGGTVVEETLPEGYPDTLGVAWDYSLVRVPVEDLPAVTDVARITVFDAAGNSATEEFTLSIDGIPPSAAFIAPASGTTVSGVFEIVVDAFDAQPGPLVVEISAGGSPIATATGPTALVFLDAEELAAGPLELTAVAFDEAGNASVPVSIDVIVEHEAEELPPPPR